ncbi:formate dehydrogenase accessory protein FdhE [Selenomonas ruminantium]|uniref:Tat proofreading chaperone FdhE n=1 Tax=Selenomonas ruminantium TaxID=971 RepID=A0A1I0W6A0_SELRU|nr:formate dehydrogenase accessory protein FdhE [Selenomonas ruminantium]SFA83553.1 Tat proofreading chaperone FdhE [Selenomonas ruminantium]
MNVTDKKMQAYLEAHPFLQETAELQLAMSAAIQKSVGPMEFPEDNEVKKLTQDGVPLLQSKDLQDRVVAALQPQISAVLAELLPIACPQPMQEALQVWAEWTEKQSMDKQAELIGLLLRQEDEKLTALMQAEQLPEQLVRTVLWQLVEALVPARLKAYDFWQDAGWAKNYCPICGRQPVLAHLRKEKEGRARFLLCDGCHAEWPFARVGCVYCGNEDLTQMHILEPEGQTAMRMDVCGKCQSYIKTYNEEGTESVYLQDWATIHLDLLAEEKGLRKNGSRLLAN